MSCLISLDINTNQDAHEMIYYSIEINYNQSSSPQIFDDLSSVFLKKWEIF